jgi:hypothetical protein
VPRAGPGPGPGRTSSDRADARTRGEDLRPGRRRQDHPQDRRHGGPAGPGDHPPLDRRERGVPPRYALAKEGLVEDILEEINEIADDATKDYGLEEGTDGTPVVREKKETIARATLRIATKFKLIGKVAPHKYGDVPPAWHRQLHPSSRAKAPAPRSWTVKSSRSSSTSVRLGGLAQGGEGSEMKHGQGTSRPSLFDGQGSSWT